MCTVPGRKLFVCEARKQEGFGDGNPMPFLTAFPSYRSKSASVYFQPSSLLSCQAALTTGRKLLHQEMRWISSDKKAIAVGHCWR